VPAVPATAAAIAASTTAPATVPPAAPVPGLLKADEDKTIQQLFSDWEDQCESHLADFKSQAGRVLSWDRELKENQKTLDEVVDLVNLLLENQVRHSNILMMIMF
jgi:hypothetical protein